MHYLVNSNNCEACNSTQLINLTNKQTTKINYSNYLSKSQLLQVAVKSFCIVLILATNTSPPNQTTHPNAASAN